MKTSEICRLCLKVCKANFQPVQEITKELLEILLVEMDLDISVNPVECKECKENLQECCDFKLVCILTEKNVIDVLESRHICKINMSEVYLKDERSNSTLFKMEEVCRFCTKPVTKFFSVDKLDENINFSNMVQKFLPEVTLNFTNNPVCCSNCFSSLKSYFTFLKNCQDVEKHIKAYCKSENLTKGKVKLNDVLQYMSKPVIFEHNAEKAILRLKKDIINEVVAAEDQSVQTYSLYPAKSETIGKEEQIIEMNAADFIDMDTISTEKQLVETFSSDPTDTNAIIHKEQLVETYFSEAGDTKQSSMEKSNKDSLLEVKMNENCDDDDEFSEGCTDENKTEDIDVAEIKIEDVDIKPNNISMERYEEKPTKLQFFHREYKSRCRNNLTNRFKSIHGKCLLSCHLCSFKTDSEDFLKKHQVIHGDNAKFKCAQCQKVFSSKLDIDNHFLRKHDNLCDLVTSKIHSCNICSYKTTKKSNLFDHINRKHSRLEKYQCNYCLQTFVDKGGLKRHISSVHLNLRPYICADCKKTFKEKLPLDRHIVSHHQQNLDLMKTVTRKIYNCDHCTFKAVRNDVMMQHVKTHGIRLMFCHHSGYKADKKDCLEKHQVIRDSNGTFKCPQCEKVFNRKQNFETHFIRKHNLCDLITSKIYSCNICSFKTTKKSNLFLHIKRKHSRLEKYQCNYCLHTFLQKINLEQHISSVHLNLRPHVCKSCKKTFKQKVNLDSHIVSCHQKNFDLMKTVTNKIYQCDHCTFKTVNNSVMKNHIKTHEIRLLSSH